MKTQTFPKAFVIMVGLAALTFSATPVVAQNSASVSTTVQTTPTLSYGAANVLKLAQAKVGEETIIAYVQKSGQGYGSLGADEIIYLREKGVSDRILSTMLDQEKKMRDATVAQQTVEQPATAAATQVTQPTAPVVVAPQYVPPQVTYVQAAPAPLIVMRDSSPRLADYGIYPRHYSYNYGCYPSYGYRSYGHYYPRASFSVGFGGHHGGFSFSSGGFRGGYCR